MPTPRLINTPSGMQIDYVEDTYSVVNVTDVKKINVERVDSGASVWVSEIKDWFTYDKTSTDTPGDEVIAPENGTGRWIKAETLPRLSLGSGVLAQIVNNGVVTPYVVESIVYGARTLAPSGVGQWVDLAVVVGPTLATKTITVQAVCKARNTSNNTVVSESSTAEFQGGAVLSVLSAFSFSSGLFQMKPLTDNTITLQVWQDSVAGATTRSYSLSLNFYTTEIA